MNSLELFLICLVLVLWTMADQADNDLVLCHHCGEPIYARPFLPFRCPICRALMWLV